MAPEVALVEEFLPYLLVKIRYFVYLLLGKLVVEKEEFELLLSSLLYLLDLKVGFEELVRTLVFLEPELVLRHPLTHNP